MFNVVVQQHIDSNNRRILLSGALGLLDKLRHQHDRNIQIYRVCSCKIYV